MDWSNDTVFKFLDYYEEEPIIWDASHPGHKNRNTIYDSWKRIQQHMDGVYTVDELKKKRDSLMASFRTNLNKMKASMKSGASAESIYTPNWFAFNRMCKFLKGKDEPRQTINSEVTQLEEQENVTHSNEQADNSFEIENDGVVLPSRAKIPNKRKTNEEQHNIRKKMDHAYSILETSFNKPAAQKDVCHIYGELVAAKLRKMGELSREICMQRIDAILFDALINPNYVPNQLPHLPPSMNQQVIAVSPPATFLQSDLYQQNQLSPIPSQVLLSHPITPTSANDINVSICSSNDYEEINERENITTYECL